MSAPLVTVRPTLDPDTGPHHVVVIAGLDGPAFATPALAELYADQLTAALASAIAHQHLPPLLALDAAAGQRAAALRAQPDALDAIQARTVSPRSALLRALRWILDGEGGEVLRPAPPHGEEPDDPGPPSTLRPGEEGAGLDRLITAAGAAIVCGEEAE